MCCLFTCVGWVIDLIQRVWTFTMSCCISSAVCCTLVTASMAGVALGYNYSLAEYVENRETNVSVYLKRGVFDDHVIDEMEWRRKGGGGPEESEQQQVAAQDDFGSQRRGNLEVGPSTPSVRRLDDSIIESNDHRQFEGSLLKLTATPLYLPPSLAMMTAVSQLDEVASELDRHQPNDAGPYNQGDSLERYKNLEGSRRKAYHIMKTVAEISTMPTDPPPIPEDTRRYPDAVLESGRRMIPPIKPDTTPIYSQRFAVPPPDSRYLWFAPQPLPTLPQHNLLPSNVFTSLSYPTPPRFTNILDALRRETTTPRPKPEKPIIVSIAQEATSPRYIRTTIATTEKVFEEESTDSDVIKTLNEPEGKEYDDEDIKGLPVRRRRSIRKSSRKRIRNNQNSITNNPESLLRARECGKNNRNSLYSKLIAAIRSMNVKSLLNR